MSKRIGLNKHRILNQTLATHAKCFRQLDVAHFDALIWLTLGTSIVVPQASAVRGVTV